MAPSRARRSSTPPAIFGQITRAGTFSSEAILITDSEHAIPVQVNRNGLRSHRASAPATDLRRMSLPFLPTNADIKVGDLLVSRPVSAAYSRPAIRSRQ